MTALPDPNEFATTMGTSAACGFRLHPDIRDRYWGYEVRSHLTGGPTSLIVRYTVAFFAVLAAVFGGIALTTSLPMLEQVSGLQWGVAIASMSVAAFLAYVGLKFRPIRVQVDTTAGEIREVVGGLLGSDVVLARYGIDAVVDVNVVASTRKPELGQVHVTLKGFGVIPIGDGAVSALRPLRDRMAAEFGLETGDERPAIWSGPLAA